nr:histidine kinase [Kibdelosporangium sp. MJ126-NF4]CEL18565.1 sensor histidine kinase [Kibdelosporangium sp. MJ126-NF4]
MLGADREAPHLAPKLAVGIVAVDFCSYSAFGLLQVIETGPSLLMIALAVLLMSCMLSLQLLFFHRWHNYLVFVLQAVLAYLPLIWFGQAWIGMPSFLAGRALLVLPSLAGWALFVVIVLTTALAQAMVNDSTLDLAYTTVTTVLFGMAIYGLARLAGLATQLHDARSELARYAVADERLRFASDLHDLLGLSLSAISLRSRTALRLLRHQPLQAKEELADILDVARQALADVRVVAGGYRELSLADECATAESMLRSANMEATVDLPDLPMPAPVRTTLATVVREGVTNVLRHSKGRYCEITVYRDGDAVVLQVVNDGATTAQQERTNDGSSGIHNLLRRVAELGGELHAGPLDGGRFRLLARIPLTADEATSDDDAVPLWSTRRPGRLRREPARSLLAAVLCMSCLAATIHVFYRDETPAEVVFSIVCLVAMLSVQLGYFSRADIRLQSPQAYAMLGLLAVLVCLPLLVLGANWVSLPGLLAGSALLVLPPRVGWAAFVVIVGATSWGRAYFDGFGVSMAFTVISTVINGLIVFGLTWMSRLVTELDKARVELARRAVAAERLRFARDLHDLLGHSLSAITLKCELTRRLIAIDVAKARVELVSIQDQARQALADVRSVASGYQDVSLDDESQAVGSLLAAADVTVRMDMRYGELPARVRTVLTALLREGVTNALRHSKVQRCEIAIRQQGDMVSLEIINDGVPVDDSTEETDLVGGSGLRNLAKRVTDLGGHLSAQPITGGRFRLRATVSARSKPSGFTGDPDGVEPVTTL